MDLSGFRENDHEIVNWICDYYETLESRPVKSRALPGSIKQQIPNHPPELGEAFATIWNDFQQIILPGMTHWQHPHFHAYFPANASLPSILGEMATAALGAQCMIWDTSPAAAELEEKLMRWLLEAYGLPSSWEGVIQDTASTATLIAILTAREQVNRWQSNKTGLASSPVFRVYGSTELHSSIDKAIQIAGIGLNNLVRIPVDNQRALVPELLEAAIEQDLESGLTPMCVIIALGSTSTLAIDPLAPVAAICRKYNIWLHVDAAYAGNALILPEYRWMIEGIEGADSFVVNPHKWLFTNFDLSAYFIKDREALLRTFSILPEYLKTETTGLVNDYRDWGIALGRRFRALKLWFVLRTFGMAGLRNVLRDQIRWADWFAEQVDAHPHMEQVTSHAFNMVCLHAIHPEWTLNDMNVYTERWLKRINASGRAYLTHTKVNGIYTIRVVLGQTYLQQHHVQELWSWMVTELADILDPPV